MSEPSVQWERAAEHPRGPTILVRVRGVYPPGSAGNEFGRVIAESIRRAVAESGAAGVILDFMALDYSWGDAIGSLAVELLDDTNNFRPSAIVAAGGTAAALRGLLEPNFLLGMAGTKLFGSEEEALAHVQRALDGSRTVQEHRELQASDVTMTGQDLLSRRGSRRRKSLLRATAVLVAVAAAFFLIGWRWTIVGVIALPWIIVVGVNLLVVARRVTRGPAPSYLPVAGILLGGMLVIAILLLIPNVKLALLLTIGAVTLIAEAGGMFAG